MTLNYFSALIADSTWPDIRAQLNEWHFSFTAFITALGTPHSARYRHPPHTLFFASNNHGESIRIAGTAPSLLCIKHLLTLIFCTNCSLTMDLCTNITAPLTVLHASLRTCFTVPAPSLFCSHRNGLKHRFVKSRMGKISSPLALCKPPMITLNFTNRV